MGSQRKTKEQLRDWLNLVEEETLEPDMPIIDPHHHLWKRNRPYVIDDLWEDTKSGHNIVGTIFVECSAEYRDSGPQSLKPVGETEFVISQAKLSNKKSSRGQPPILGCVSHANLMLGEKVQDVLEEHLSCAPKGFLKGIRHSVAYYPFPPKVGRYTGRLPGLMNRPDFREGFSMLAKFQLSFDAWLVHTQITELTDLARKFPETTIIFDHFGGPLGIGSFSGRHTEIFPLWKKHVTELSKCENVYAKLGGLAMPLNGWGWDLRERPANSDEIVTLHKDYYLTMIDLFGPNRCMFESNFPVDKFSVSYNVLWNALKKIAEPFSIEEKSCLFKETASKVYKI